MSEENNDPMLSSGTDSGADTPPPDFSAQASGQSDMGGGMDMSAGMGGGTGTPEDKAKIQDSGPFYVRTLKRILRLIGVSFPGDIPQLKEQKDVNLSQYTYRELRHLPAFTRSEAERAMSGLNVDILGYSQNVAQASESWAREAKCLRLLAPEVQQAEQIMISSIMSPNDLQTEAVSITVENTGLGDDLEQKLSNELTDFFNNDYNLGSKLYDWLKNSLYGTGATCLLILPQSNINILNKAVDADMYMNGRDPKKEIIKPTERTRDVKPGIDKIYAGENLEGVSNVEPLLKSSGYSNEAFTESYEFSQLSEEIFNKFNGLVDGDITKSESMRDRSKVNNFTKDLTESIHKLLSDNTHHVYFTADPSIIKKSKDRISDKSENIWKQIENNFLFKDRLNPVYMVNSDPDSEEENTTATVVTIPSHCVVPIAIPGDSQHHIGYFILVDKWGAPLTDNTQDYSPTNGPRKLTEATMQATFGYNAAALFNHSSANDTQRFEMTMQVFSVMLRNLMEHKLEEYGLGGSKIEQHEAFSSAIFRHLLMKKRCGIVFVPAAMMVYYAFDYHDDGTGKSLLEDAREIFALRNTLMVAQVMAGAENSINQRTISVNVDPKNANALQFLDQIRNAFIEKRMMRWDNNPHTIQKDLLSRSLTIIPKGLPGTEDSFSIETDNRSNGTIDPNSELLEKLTQMGIQYTEVPASALNKTSEEEYATTVASTNLYFNNNIKGKQRVVQRVSDKFIQLYIRYSPMLIERLSQILDESDETEKQIKKEDAKIKSSEGLSQRKDFKDILYPSMEADDEPPNFNMDDDDEDRPKKKKKDDADDPPDFEAESKTDDDSPDTENNEEDENENDNPPDFDDTPKSDDKGGDDDDPPDFNEGDAPADEGGDDTEAPDPSSLKDSSDDKAESLTEDKDEKDKNDKKEKYKEYNKDRTKAPESKEEIKRNKDSRRVKLRKIINNAHLKLPPPRIIVDKVHYEHINEYLNTIDQITQTLYSDDLLGGQSDYQQVLSMIRAEIKHKIAEDFIKRIGFQSNYELPKIEDISTSEIKSLLISLINHKKGMDDIKQHIGDKVANGNQNDAFGSGGGFGGGFGSDMGGGMGGDLGGGMSLSSDNGGSMDANGEETPPDFQM